METKKAGQGMIAIGFILGIVVLTMFFSGVEEKQYNPNMSPQSLVHTNSVEVPLARNRQGHYVVTGMINDREVEFLLDTGATDVVVPEGTAKRLGLPYGRQGKAMTANGPITIWQTRIDRLRIGEIELNDISASINPRMGSGSILLGMSALGQIEFIQQGNTLTLRQKSL